MLIRTIAALGALAAIGIALVIAIPAIANTSPCSNSAALPNSASAGLVADCNASSPRRTRSADPPNSTGTPPYPSTNGLA